LGTHDATGDPIPAVFFFFFFFFFFSAPVRAKASGVASGSNRTRGVDDSVAILVILVIFFVLHSPITRGCRGCRVAGVGAFRLGGGSLWVNVNCRIKVSMA
jgi:hypothetical protein